MLFESRRDRGLLVLTALAALVLLGFLLARGILREVPGVNSYGALADAILHGRLFVEKCPEIDCALFNGKTYIIFPPLPALLAMPFVAAFGFGAFKGFILLALVISCFSLVIWNRIFRALDIMQSDRLWLLLALAFASPLFQVTLRADGVWFFAQTLGFLMMSLSIWAVVCRNSLALAGLFVALAFLCRQMAIFYPLFLVFLAMNLMDPDRKKTFLESAGNLVTPVLLAAIPVLAALALIFAYNWVRFGNPLDTGYAYIHNPGIESFIGRRIADLGLFSRDYALFNVLYLFVQGVHFEFTGPYLTKLTGLDKAGVALVVASPWLLLAFYSRLDRVFAAGAAVIAGIAGITVFYHSNGADQINTQRYVLDWLPILIVLMLRGERPAAFAALPLLVTWGVATNSIVVLVSAAYRL
jgi:hypothetical protein